MFQRTAYPNISTVETGTCGRLGCGSLIHPSTVCVYLCVCVCARAHACIYIHTHTHICIHVHVYACSSYTVNKELRPEVLSFFFFDKSELPSRKSNLFGFIAELPRYGLVPLLKN
jgi:hypothetical protein